MCASLFDFDAAKEFRDKQIKRIVDRVYDYFTGHSARDYLTSQELYTAVLLVYK